MLLLIAGGIGLVQAVSDPHQVTLRWLRLGGIISLSLIAVAGVVLGFSPIINQAPNGDVRIAFSYEVAVAAATFPALQLILVQRAIRHAQRITAGVGFAAIAFVGSVLMMSSATTRGQSVGAWEYWPTMMLSAGLTGGFLMTMLLGHAYLTAGNEMTQKPFLRLVLVLAVLLVLRLAVSLLLGAWPYLSLDVPRSQQMWNTLMVTTRYGVGLLVPGVFTYMIWDCVKRRSNQSATGILYVATVLVMIGEGIALGLIGETGVVF